MAAAALTFQDPTTAADGANAAPPLQRLNHRHEGILRWLLANPQKPLSQCAIDLGYTQPWLSVVIHSQAFQAELKTRQLLLFGEASLEIKDKLVGVAHLALDKIIEAMPGAPAQFALDATKEVMRSLGYTAPRFNPQQPLVQVNVQAGVSAEELALARQAMLTHAQGAKVLTHDPSSAPAE